MTIHPTGEKIADIAVPVGWLGLFISHLTEINAVAQFVLLLTSIVSTIFAIRYYRQRIKK